jgi:hypothetical protein
MIETDKKKVKDAEYTKEHTITQEDLRKMILEKFNRATAYYEAVRKREGLCKEV